MQQVKRLLSAVLVGICAVSPCMTVRAGAAEDVGNLSPKGAQVYLDVLENAEFLYGKARIAESSPLDGMWTGLCMAKLIDFDGDAIPELYYVTRQTDYPEQQSGMPIQRLVTYVDGAGVSLSVPESVSNFATDMSPTTLLYIGADKAYLVDGHELMNGGVATLYVKQGDKMVSALTYVDALGENPDGTWGARQCKLNDKTVTSEQLESELAAFTAGMQKQEYTFWGTSDFQMNPVPTVAETMVALRALTSPTANPSDNKVTVDGTEAQLAAYKINGSNYFKLRDLAAALDGTDKQFAVQWVQDSQRIELTSGEPYAPDGSENKPLGMGGKTASVSRAAVHLGGKALDLTAYTIDGSNYFKLRDLGDALGFAVSFDEGSGTVQLSTK